MDIEIQIPQAGCSNFQTEVRSIEVGIWIYNCRKLEVGFKLLDVAIWAPEDGSWNPITSRWNSECNIHDFETGSWSQNSGSVNLEVGFWDSTFHLSVIGIWSPISGSWMLDSSKLIWTGRLNSFSAQKRAKKREKTAVFKGGNLLEETPVETRGGPWGPVGARAPYYACFQSSRYSSPAHTRTVSNHSLYFL